MIKIFEKKAEIMNCIAQINGIKTAMVEDLIHYSNKEEPNPLYLNIKQKQITALEGAASSFEEAISKITREIETINNALENHDEQKFKLEACLIYYGVSITEIQIFTQRPIEQIYNDLNKCFVEKWRQVPLAFINDLDQGAIQKGYDQIKIAMNQNNEIEYITPKTTEEKYCNTPIIDWKTVLTQNQNGKKTNQ